MSNPILDEIIEIVIATNFEIWNNTEKIPSVFYIGSGKSGSKSICNGLETHTVAHWHSIDHFENTYKCNLLSKNNYDLYDLVIYLGKKNNFKPLIVESIRDPIEFNISHFFEIVNALLDGYFDKKDYLNQGYMQMYTILKSDISELSLNNAVKIISELKEEGSYIFSREMWKKHFNIDLKSIFDKKRGYCYSSQPSCNLLLLRYENINDWKEIFNDIGYHFVPNHINNTRNKSHNIPLYYDYVLKNISFQKKDLERIYFRYKSFYTEDELDIFYKKWGKPELLDSQSSLQNFSNPNPTKTIPSVL